MAIRYWLGVVSGAQAEWARRNGSFQVSPGLHETLSEMGLFDGLVLYSPRVRAGEDEPLRDFTAIGRIADKRPVRVDGDTVPGEHWRPWRRRVDFAPEITPVPLRLMSPVLDLTSTGINWAEPLRRGLIPLSKNDFNTLRLAMAPPAPEERMAQPPR